MRSSAPNEGSRGPLPPSIFGYIWRTDARNQLLLVLLTVVVFLLSMAPLEFQRRIINNGLGGADLDLLILLCLAYAATALAMGGLKLGLNVFRGYAGEKATRRLRERVHTACAVPAGAAARGGVEIEMVVAEVEPVGGFVGMAFSEPLLQGGILVTVFGYMLVIQPWMALVSIALFVPQMIFVPVMQRAINRRTRARIWIMRDMSAGLLGDKPAASAAPFARQTRRVFDLNMQIFKWKFTMNFFMNGLYHLSVVGVFLVGGWFVLAGHATVGTIVAFATGIAQVNDPWGDLVNYFRDSSAAQVKYRLIAGALAPAAREAAV
ncbi:MAG TPA: ABC transporter ATP-binding protein [Alphaproteobacteria bacterium]|jgi:ABC-type bacteriocin/lantibiotic exporter with double-glycine peptidase domain